MMSENNLMLAELRQIRAELWEESGHDFHKMVQIIEKEAREIMRKYGKILTKPVEADLVVCESERFS